MKVLVAEDKPAMADLLTRALQRAGHSALVAHDGHDALAFACSGECDVILLDLMMPRMDGFTILTRLREARIMTPTLILSARDGMDDIVRGLDLGADDYLTKPFVLEVLLARIRALSRRLPLSAPVNLKFRELTLNSNTHVLHRNGRTTVLTRTEFALMEVLMRRAGSIVTRETLIEAGWGFGAEVNESTVYVFIRMLRTKIGEPQYLHTARSVGYILRS